MRSVGGTVVALVLFVPLMVIPSVNPWVTPVGSALTMPSTPSSSWGAASSPVANFSAAIQRLVDLVAVAGSGALALVWVRVAVSWFSNDITKKIQAKDRARDALIGTLIFVAALSGLIWGLANWVLTGG